MPTELAYIGIGSNLGDPVTIVREAFTHLSNIKGCRLTGQSSLYRSEPLGDIPQDDYVNAVAALQTNLQPSRLLLELQAIEQAFYRQRDAALKWGPRTLDLDLILFGNRVIDDSQLRVPHAEMQNRLFVLTPLSEVGGDIYIPGLGSLSFLIDAAPPLKMTRIDD